MNIRPSNYRRWLRHWPCPFNIRKCKLKSSAIKICENSVGNDIDLINKQFNYYFAIEDFYSHPSFH